MTLLSLARLAPPQTIRVSHPFRVSETEVTNEQFEKFRPEHRSLRGKNGFSKENDEAVIYVSWHDAVAFCAWLSQREGRTYRLPTEEEWEYACRCGGAASGFCARFSSGSSSTICQSS